MTSRDSIESDEVPADLASQRLGYQRIGTGPRFVILLHEWLAAHDNYTPIHAYLNADAFSWIFADLRGYGLSRHVEGSFSIDEAAADVLRLADILGADRFYLIGHSMSAMIAQRVALITRQRVKRMVLISPVPPSGFKTDAAGFKSMAAVIDDKSAAKRAINARTSERYGAGWMARKLALMSMGISPEPMLGYLRMFTATDFAAEAAGLDIPIKVLLGANDIEAYRLDSVSRSFSIYPDLLIEECQEAGHYMMLEAPVWTASRIEAFMDAA